MKPCLLGRIKAGTEVNMETYSLPRRLWRIIYPALLFLAMQFVIVFAVGMTAGLTIVFREIIGGAALNVAALMDELLSYVSDYGMLITLITNIVALAVFVPMWFRTRKNLERYKGHGFLISLLLVFGFFAGFNIIQMFIFSAVDILQYFPSYKELTNFMVGGPFWVQILAIGVIAPITEEIVFRGVIMGRMNWLPVWLSVIIQALLFGLAHMNLFQGMYAFLAGLLLGLIFVKYRSIVLVIAGHMAFNLASVLAGEYLPEDSTWIAILALIVGAALAIFCAIFLIRRKGAKSTRVVEQQIPDNPAPESPAI